MAASILSSCMDKRIDIVESGLREKYGKDFKVTRIVNIHMGGSSSVYDAICCPSDNEKLLFTVSVYDEGKNMTDGYETALLGEAMKRDAAAVIGRIAEDYEIYMEFTSFADGFREGMSAKNFNLENECVCYTALVINTDKKADIEPQKLYGAVSDMYKEWGSIQGGINILLADGYETEEIRELMSKSPRIDSSLLDICAQRFSSKVNNGIIVKSIDEMTNDLY